MPFVHRQALYKRPLAGPRQASAGLARIVFLVAFRGATNPCFGLLTLAQTADFEKQSAGVFSHFNLLRTELVTELKKLVQVLGICQDLGH